MTDPAGRRVLTELYAGQDWAADARWKDRRASKARTECLLSCSFWCPWQDSNLQPVV
jgi:hypothetical protein